MTVHELTTDEKTCLKEALRTHVEFLATSAAKRPPLGGIPNALGDALLRLSKEALDLKGTIELALTISLELPDA